MTLSLDKNSRLGRDDPWVFEASNRTRETDGGEGHTFEKDECAGEGRAAGLGWGAFISSLTDGTEERRSARATQVAG